MFRYFLSGQPVKFQRADDPLYVMFMNGRRRRFIHFPQFFMQHMRALFRCQPLQFLPVRTRFIFRKIHISNDRLNIETGAAHQDRNMAMTADYGHGLLCHLLKTDHMEFLKGLQHIHQIMRHSLHLLRADLCGPDIHMFIYLHGIRRQNLSADGLCERDGKPGLSHSRGSGQDY